MIKKLKNLTVVDVLIIMFVLGTTYYTWAKPIAKSAKPAVKLSVVASKLSGTEVKNASICVSDDVDAENVVKIMIELQSEGAITSWSVRQGKDKICVSVR